jgi:uncharacterized cupredoxin-like copper-binding protein
VEAHPVRARLEPEGLLQVVEVAVRGAYRPNAIVARAGVPLRILFRRDDADPCSERVVFSTPRIDRRLTPNRVTAVDLPAQPAGEIRFTCGMGRYRGRIELVDGGRRFMLARVLRRLSGSFQVGSAASAPEALESWPRERGRMRSMVTAVSRATVLLIAVVLLSACSAGVSTTGTDTSPRRIDLTMTDQLTFEPATIQVRRGETVRFVVRNVSNADHEAYIGTEEEQQLHATVHSALSSEEQTKTTHMGYAVHVPAFGNGEMLAKFDEDLEYVIGCHYPGHYEAGMRAVIEVSE